MIRLFKNFPGNSPVGFTKNVKTLRARFLAWAIETAIGFLIFVSIFGSVAYPLYLGVPTTGWDSYALLLWGFLGMVCIAAFMMRVIASAKEGYRALI